MRQAFSRFAAIAPFDKLMIHDKHEALQFFYGGFLFVGPPLAACRFS